MDFTLVEQDKRSSPDDANELPTYDDLAAQHGPNSRFGHDSLTTEGISNF
jgi:hypothetical protein